MADRDKITERGNVQDRRGTRSSGSVKSVGGIGLTGLAIILLVGVISGPETAVELLTDVTEIQDSTIQYEQQYEDTSVYAGEDDYETFVSTVVGSTNALWSEAFASSGYRYEEPTLVLFRGATQSRCGGAVSQVGPHYCPADQTIYLDETFFEDLTERLGAKGGDVAQAYVIAHEVGHHVQNLLGSMERVQQARSISTQAGNEASIKLELQADCFAGIWSGMIDQQGVLETNEIYEAIDAAGAVGDDSIQKRTTGTVQPESRTHGSSAQRKERFTTGFKTGSVEACDTF